MHGSRVLVIGDNLGSLLSFERSRCKDLGHLLLCRRVAARSIATSISVRWRYAESDCNPADWHSRAA